MREKMSTTMTGSPLQIRLKEDQRTRINRGAKLSGESVSDFVRRAACAEAEHLESERSEFSLSDERFAAFLEALDAPPQPNEALNRFLHTQAPWD